MRFRNPFVLVILGIILVLFAKTCSGASDSDVAMILDKTKTEKYIVAASKASRYALPKTRPTVVVMTSAWFLHNICKDIEPCNVLGMFHAAVPEYIFVNQDTPLFLQQTVIVHEYVHYLQWADGQTMGASQTCGQRALLEAEAYVAGYRFELENLKYTVGLDITGSNCKESPSK